MTDALGASADPISIRTLSFVQRCLRVSFSTLVWIDASDVGFSEYLSLGLPDQLMQDYFAGVSQFDPLSISNTLGYNRCFVALGSDVVPQDSPAQIRYRSHLAHYGIEDELDMLVCVGAVPVASIAIHRRPVDPAFIEDDEFWLNLQSYVEFNMRFHPRVQSLVLSSALKGQYGLSKRETEVAMLVSDGASNSDIAEILCIKTGTVKTHIVRLLDKLGVSSRYGIMARCHAIRMDARN
ncbi:helix-turn-helix transcriptional regulator [Sphingosinicella xenopeptidilytica]|uniref:LuxR C-terminal-related transcriptional regulator n=1 Tax=Sphingosinicella xenopeptidilytica TaxID=364098 RepID=A0ABW3C777_SPHXN